MGIHKSSRHEGENGIFEAFDTRMHGRVEESAQGYALEAIDEPDYDGEEGVETDGPEDECSEEFYCEAEVEEEERHFDGPVHPDIYHFFSEEGLLSELVGGLGSGAEAHVGLRTFVRFCIHSGCSLITLAKCLREHYQKRAMLLFL